MSGQGVPTINTKEQMNSEELKNALEIALTEYDRRQQKGARYNPNALGIYFQMAEQVAEDVVRGATPRDAIAAGFHGPLVNFLLKRLGFGAATEKEVRGGSSWVYAPASDAQR
jgi:hypothetical protein